jgi:hypothetical protein
MKMSESYEIAKKAFTENREGFEKAIITEGDKYYNCFHPVKPCERPNVKCNNPSDIVNNHKPRGASVIPGYFEACETDEQLQAIWRGVLTEDITNCVFNPWLNLSSDYGDYVSKNGNEDDETNYISAVFISILTLADYEKYQALIAYHSDINVNGL